MTGSNCILTVAEARPQGETNMVGCSTVLPLGGHDDIKRLSGSYGRKIEVFDGVPPGMPLR